MKNELTDSRKDGSTVENKQPVAVRHIVGYMNWFVPNEELTGAAEQFFQGILSDVTFKPKAAVMRDVFCGSGRISEAEAIGTLTISDDVTMPQDAARTCEVGYDPQRKVFFNIFKPAKILLHADYLLLLRNGNAIAGWKK